MVKPNCPGEDKYHLYVEDNEEEGIHIVTKVELAPTPAHELHTTFVGIQLDGTGFMRSKSYPREQPGEKQHTGRYYKSYNSEDSDETVLS